MLEDEANARLKEYKTEADTRFQAINRYMILQTARIVELQSSLLSSEIIIELNSMQEQTRRMFLPFDRQPDIIEICQAMRIRVNSLPTYKD